MIEKVKQIKPKDKNIQLLKKYIDKWHSEKYTNTRGGEKR